MTTLPVVTVTKPSKAYVPAHTTRVFGPGQLCLDAQAGDVVLVRGSGFVSTGIRVVERLRVEKPFCWTNHACVVLNGGADAHVVQETGKGQVATPLADLGAETYTVTHFTDVDEAQLLAGLRFLTMTEGTGYGYLTIPADLFNSVTGIELGFVWGNRMVCSTSTARYMERLGYVPDRPTSAIIPANLAWDLGVTIPPKG